MTLKNDSNPLSNCVITLSIYADVERDFLFNLAELLGARYYRMIEYLKNSVLQKQIIIPRCQNTFARKRNIDRNVYASTHLICPTPEGDKYNGAIRWNLPVVNALWLMDCAQKNTLVNETPYLVGESRSKTITYLYQYLNYYLISLKINDSYLFSTRKHSEK